MKREIVTEDVSNNTYVLLDDETSQGDLFDTQSGPVPQEDTSDSSGEEARRQRILDAIQDSAARGKRRP